MGNGQSCLSPDEVNSMQLVEQHVIDRKDPRYSVIDEAAFKSKNLYNAALYEIRQAFIHEGKYLNYNEMDKLMQQHEAYKALPRKVSQWVLKGLDKNWKSFFESLKAYAEDPSKFTGRPRLPKYKHKTEGRNILTYTMQAVSRGKRSLQRGIIKRLHQSLARDVRPGLVGVSAQEQALSYAEARVVRRQRIGWLAQVFRPHQSRLRTAQRSGNNGWNNVVRK